MMRSTQSGSVHQQAWWQAKQSCLRLAVRCSSSWGTSTSQPATTRASQTRKDCQPTQQTSSQAEDDWNDSNSQDDWRDLARGTQGGNPSTDWDGTAGEASTSGRTSWGDREGSSGRRGGRGGGSAWGNSNSRGSTDWGGSQGREGSERMRGRRDWGSEARQRGGPSTGRPASGRVGREWATGRGGWERGRGRQEAGNSGEVDSWRRRPEDRPYSGPDGPKSVQLKDLLKGEALYGINPVLGALEAMRREVYTLYVQEASEATKKREGVSQAVTAMKQRGGAVQYVDKHELNMVTENRLHQGLVLDCAPLDWERLEEFEEASKASQASPAQLPVWLALDEIGDPQNLGAAIRAAYFLGAAGVLCCARNSAPPSPAVSKASAGALEHLPVHACHSMPRTLSRARELGWAVIGAGNEEAAVSCRGFAPCQPTILVVGNEGRGLRTAVQRACTTLLRVDSAVAAGEGRRAPLGVDSLNVSVATGILLHQLLQAASAPGEALGVSR